MPFSMERNMSNLKHNGKNEADGRFLQQPWRCISDGQLACTFNQYAQVRFCRRYNLSGLAGVIGVVIGTLLQRFAQHFLNYLIDE
jgi:hypothetical protein